MFHLGESFSPTVPAPSLVIVFLAPIPGLVSLGPSSCSEGQFPQNWMIVLATERAAGRSALTQANEGWLLVKLALGRHNVSKPYKIIDLINTADKDAGISPMLNI